jgi:hypothetical protein
MEKARAAFEVSFFVCPEQPLKIILLGILLTQPLLGSS